MDDAGSMHNYQSIEVGGDTSEAPPTKDESKKNKSRGVSSIVFEFILQHSYIGCLIVMMAWSIMFHSWLALVLLLTACLIWIMPAKRSICLSCSPVILFYALCLLVIDYVYGFDLTQSELPSNLSSGYNLEEIGLVKWDYPIIPLAIKGAFTFMLWLTLRQFMWEYSKRRRALPFEAASLETLDGQGTDPEHKSTSGEHLRFRAFSACVWSMLCKYWIFLCASLFLVMALQEAVVYRIIYMVLFLFFLITFQISYSLWRLGIKLFWTVVILYSMLVLIVLYIFQFKDIHTRWQDATGMSSELMSDIGIREYEKGELFVKLLTPTSFLIFIILHLHYFQATFLKLSDVNRYKNQSDKTDGDETTVRDGRPIREEDTNEQPIRTEDTSAQSTKRKKRGRNWLNKLISNHTRGMSTVLWSCGAT